ncbi:FKBP-type peptidyl-prolyl cis-trans isomerase [Flavobacterium sp. N2038]|uniref:FKBP-type peptidyl-prolyl cis-trans isomerase n=1 Tax=Flavobacterium sp. N2038 TaxID=2986829 RepID=UPI0022251681|nr:FKBP-type peptidylprolyl isomerase [Flavobacterium sp. N2038]
MNKFKYYFVLLLAGIAIVSCNKKDDDEVVVVPLRDYTEQYKADNDSIIKYLNRNYITVTNAPGTPQDQDVTISKITDPATQPSIMSYLNSETFPKLLTRDVYNDNITYKVYYLVLREGTGHSPVNTDRVYNTYVGNLLNGTQFDSSNNIPGYWDLDGLGDRGVFVDGWKEIFPKFKTGTASAPDASGVVTYNNFGAGVMFLPSGLAYYGSSQTNIPAYSPLVFSFKLMDLARIDHDRDGVFDFNEDVNHDGYVYDFSNKTLYPNPPANLIDDTDGDGTPDFLDIDDDGDGYTTLFEITKPTGAPVTGISKYYPYDPIPDSPVTPNIDETETWGIPAVASDGTVDYISPGRLRLHVDKNHHAIK